MGRPRPKGRSASRPAWSGEAGLTEGRLDLDIDGGAGRGDRGGLGRPLRRRDLSGLIGQPGRRGLSGLRGLFGRCGLPGRLDLPGRPGFGRLAGRCGLGGLGRCLDGLGG